MFLEATHLDLNVCLDVGHANMNEGVETAFRLLKAASARRTCTTTMGTDDSHLFPLLAEGGTHRLEARP